jgi:hypothetical protein
MKIRVTRNISIILLLASPFSVAADNYCNVSHVSPTFNLGFEQVGELIWKNNPKANVECGVLKNLYKLEAGHTTEYHYKNVVLLVDQDDERFVAVAKTEKISVFAYANNLGNEYHIALKGEVARLRPLAPGALALMEFKNVTLPDGFSVYMPIFERVL